MGVARIDAADAPLEHLGTDREAHAVAGMPRGTQEVRPALHRLPRRPQIAGEQLVRDAHLGALVRHDVGIRTPLPGHMACHRAVPVQKSDPLSDLHLLGRRGMSLCHPVLPSMRVITRTMGEPIHHIPRLPTRGYWKVRAPDHHPCTRRSAAGSPHMPRHEDFRAAPRACAWPRYPPRCSVASWPGWYDRRAPARPADSPRPARLCARPG
jgi:hypothetical protein